MFLDDFLSFHHATLPQLSEAVAHHLMPDDGEIIYVTGSLVEGLGNYYSDIDVYLISDRDFNDRFVSGSVIIIPFGSCPIDVEVISSNQLRSLVNRLSRFPSEQLRDQRAAVEFSPAELKFLHNLVIARPLFGGAAFEQLVACISPRALSRLSFDYSITAMDALHADIIGLIQDRDFATARYLLHQFLGHLASAFLAALGNTNPAEKWRIRKLNTWRSVVDVPALPVRYSVSRVVQEFTELYIECSANQHSVIEALSRIIHLSWLIVPWGQQRFLSGEDLGRRETRRDQAAITSVASEPSGISGSPVEHNNDSLPRLDVRCRIRIDPKGLCLSALNSPRSFYINSLAYEMLLLFDGRRTASDVANHIGTLTSAPSGEIVSSIHDFRTILLDHGFL